MTRFWWVRHGPTRLDGLYGWTDVPADLSDKPALSRLSAYLPEPAVIVSSDLARSITTADAIAGNRRRLPHDPDLREVNFGDWETKTYSQVAKSHPDLSKAYWITPGPVAPPNGESWNAVQARVSATVDNLATAHEGADIIVVAHFAVILTQIQRAADMSANAALAFKIDNLSVTGIEHLGKGWRILGVNHKP